MTSPAPSPDGSRSGESGLFRVAADLIDSRGTVGSVGLRTSPDGSTRTPKCASCLYHRVYSRTTEPVNARQLVGTTGALLERNLISPVYRSDFNRDEQDVAVYLDAEEAFVWWHRNVARAQYGIQGWKRGKVYPDFIFAVQSDGVGNRITVLDTKGDQLDNLDTGYKREMLSFLSDHFSWDDGIPARELELVRSNGETVQCTLILVSEWQARLPTYLGSVRTE